MPTSEVGDPQADSCLFRLLTRNGSYLLMIYCVTVSLDRKWVQGWKRSAASGFFGLGRRFVEGLMRSMLYSAVLAVAVYFSLRHTVACDQFMPFGQLISSNLLEEVGVAATPVQIVVCHTGKVVAFNPERNVSDWVAYCLSREDRLSPVVERKDNFRADHRVPKQHQVVHSDYTRTGYDRGHLAPVAAMHWSFDTMNDTFFMTDIAPQVGPGFNQHIWKSLLVTGPPYRLLKSTSVRYIHSIASAIQDSSDNFSA